MTRYITARLLQGIIALFVLATFLFVLARLIGNPVDMMLGDRESLQDREIMIHRLGLDRPYYLQYGDFMWGLLRGNLGESIKLGRPVAELFFERFPNTLKLALVSMAIALVFGLALGMAAGTHRGSFIDHLSGGMSVIGMSAPVFWVGLMLMLLFSVELRILPVARMGGPESYILPAFSLSLFSLAGTARLVRSSMIEVLDSEFVKLARIKGASQRTVVWKHGLRNAMLPVFTFAGVQLAMLLNGSVVIESIFVWPGVGQLIYQGIVARDYPMVQGCLLIIGMLILVINMVIDIMYAYIDPRIRVLRSV
jgi:peptide/nickel transport system permease protein